MSKTNIWRSSAVLPGVCRFLPCEKQTRFITVKQRLSSSTGKVLICLFPISSPTVATWPKGLLGFLGVCMFWLASKMVSSEPYAEKKILFN